MTTELVIDVDLRFEVEVPGRPTVHGTLRTVGDFLDLEVDRPEIFAGRADAEAIRALADGLARHGMRVRVREGDTHLITLGDTRAPWWQRRATGSKHIRLGSLRGAWTSARSRGRGSDVSVLPDRELAPAATLWPLAPTFQRRVRRQITTTHGEEGGGSPRLVMAPGPHPWPGDRTPTFWITESFTTIGSDAGCDIRLSGLAGLHAEIRHDDADEFVLVAFDPDTKVNGGGIRQQLLRTGSRVQLGEWTLIYTREEYADHGRPHGGRIGGELGHQKPQAPRSTQPGAHRRKE